MQKYKKHGWRFLKGSRINFGTHIRWVGDEECWTVKLDMEDVDVPEHIIEADSRFDPLVHNSWNLSRRYAKALDMEYEMADPSCMQFNYTFSPRLFTKCAMWMHMMEVKFEEGDE